MDGGKSALAGLKIAMLDFPSPGSEACTADHIAVACSALECGVLLSVADSDLEAFARNVSQVKPYYAVVSPGALPVLKSRKCHILGLNLMHLLVENRLSEFHAELELLSEEEALTSYVSFPIDLERQLMVGSYDEVLNATSRVPDRSYGLFMDHLVRTVRDSIADCLEVAFTTMTMQDAVSMMKLGSVKELLEYIEECRDDWIVEDESVVFQPPATGSKAADIPSMKLISQSLSYATELERII